MGNLLDYSNKIWQQPTALFSSLSNSTSSSYSTDINKPAEKFVFNYNKIKSPNKLPDLTTINKMINLVALFIVA